MEITKRGLVRDLELEARAPYLMNLPHQYSSLEGVSG